MRIANKLVLIISTLTFFLFCPILYSDEGKLAVLAEIISKLEKVDVKATYDARAFSLSSFERYADVYSREYVKKYDKLDEIISDKQFFYDKNCQDYLSLFFKKSKCYPLMVFLIRGIFGQYPQDDKLAYSYLKIFVERAKHVKKSMKWNELYLIEQLISSIYFNDNLNKKIRKELLSLYPNEKIKLSKEYLDLFDLKKPPQNLPKPLEYDAKSYFQFTHILFALLNFQENKLKKTENK